MDFKNHLITDFVDRHYFPADEHLIPLRKQGETGNIPIILKETEMTLKMLLSLKKPKRILEVGTAIGYSTAFFAYACPDAEVITIEKKEAMYDRAAENLENLGLSARVRLLKGDGQETIDQLRERGTGDVDFVFIDAAKSHYLRFLESALTVTSPGAVIVSDNILQHGMTLSDEYDPHRKHKTSIRRMREYLDFICTHHELETYILSVGDGLAVSIQRK